jgi:hypothetical protein
MQYQKIDINNATGSINQERIALLFKERLINYLNKINGFTTYTNTH